MNRVIDIYINFEKQSSTTYTFKQSDTTLLQCFFDGNINLSNKSIRLYWKCSNKKIIEIEASTIDTDKNIAIINLTDSCVAVSGRIEFEINLIENETMISTFKAFGKIEESIKGDINEDNSTYLERVENLLIDLQNKLDDGYFDGKSAYEIWIDEGNVGTEEDFFESLKGADGIDGYTPVKGTDYWTNADKAEIVQSAVTQVETDIQSTITSIENTADTANSTANTAKSIAEGANQALSYGNYQTMITAFNALANDVYNVGQNVMIITLEVPDLWISGIESTSQSYTYTTDEAFTTALATNGYVQVGYYKLSALETQKVDLTDYVTNTDYATSNKGGVFKTQSNYGVDINNGFLRGLEKTYANYSSADNTMFVSKGTLENVITGKSLETANNKVTSISNASTNTQYPSAKAVYDLFNSIIDGDEVSY